MTDFIFIDQFHPQFLDCGNKQFTCAQYWDLATATRSLRMGWDWDTRGETAWMTAVNFGYGLIPGRQEKHGHWFVQCDKSAVRKQK